MSKILWTALSKIILNMSFDVKKNIMNILDSSNDIVQSLLKEIVVSTFSDLTYIYEEKLDEF